MSQLSTCVVHLAVYCECRPTPGCRGCEPWEEVTYAIPTTFKSTSTCRCAVVARKFIQAGRVGLTLAVRATLFIGAVEDIEVVVTNLVACKDISDVFQERRLSNASLSNKKDGVWPIRPVF